MPPRKRNRDGEQQDPDPDQLDKDELKGMLRQSLDEKAELVAQMEQQKKENEAKMEEQKKALDRERAEWKAELNATKERERKLHVDRIILYYCAESRARDADGYYFFYPNWAVLQQAEAAGLQRLVDMDENVLGDPEIWSVLTKFHSVETCEDLVDIFENGLDAGAVVDDDPQKGPLFSVILAVDMTDPSRRLVVAARSSDSRYNSLLARYLDSKAGVKRPMIQQFSILQSADMNNSSSDHIYHQEIQDRVGALDTKDYSAVLKGLWIPDREATQRDGKERAYKADLDFNRMVEVAAGSGAETEIFFSLDFNLPPEDGNEEEEEEEEEEEDD